MNLSYFFRRIKGKIIRSIFHYQTKNVFALPLIGGFLEKSPVVLLSMLQETDVQMYLLAVKSMMRYLIVNKVVIVCDPDLSSQSKELIKKHIGRVEFLDALDYQHEKIPTGGTWERLYAISHLTNEYYVIQMDADILVMKPPKEVIESIQLNHSFILGTEFEYQQLPIEEMTDIAQQWVDDAVINNTKLHIQKIAESYLMRLVKPLGCNFYTRGCSGFSGFSKGSLTPEIVLKISETFYKELGEQWDSWGTEQFISNLLLSNQENVRVLPVDTYNSSNCYRDDCVLSHFIGTFRFVDMQYVNLAQQVLKELTNDLDKNSYHSR